MRGRLELERQESLSGGPQVSEMPDPPVAGGVLLLVDDNSESLASLDVAFARSSYRRLTASNGQQALAIINDEPVDVVVTDLRMPEMDGMEVLRRVLALEDPPQVILLTAHGSIDSAREALHMGAFDYLTKPVNLKELRSQVEKAMAVKQLHRENRRLHAELDEKFGFEGIIGQSQEMQEIIEKVRLLAPSRASVLILGESGTGKELIARAIHRNGPRRKRPFVAVHCAAVPETLLESELFGHEKGAFTGAIARKTGYFEQAHGGTLFLDEIGEIPLSMQVKLLRVLETLEFRRVGGVDSIRVDVRFVAATNRDLAEEVRKGNFREDLYYRLNVVTLPLPPLRRRLADIPLLVRSFVDELARENQRTPPRVDPEVINRLTAWQWPGNIRELRNVIESMMLFQEDNVLGPGDLPPHLRDLSGPGPESRSGLGAGATLEEAETFLIKQALEAHSGNRTHAAASLGISRRTLQRKLKELDMD